MRGIKSCYPYIIQPVEMSYCQKGYGITIAAYENLIFVLNSFLEPWNYKVLFFYTKYCENGFSLDCFCFTDIKNK